MVLCRMKMYEMKKDGRYGIGFIDPKSINEDTWTRKLERKDTEKSLVEFLMPPNTQPKILLPYNFS